MTYDWNNPEEFGPKLKPGVKHTVTVTRVMREKKDGSPYVDGDGNKKLGVAFQNGDGEDGFEFFSLAGRFEAKFRKFIQAALSAQELADLISRGIEPVDFLKAEIAEPTLVGRWVSATGSQRGDFMDWKYERCADAAPAAAAGEKPRF